MALRHCCSPQQTTQIRPRDLQLYLITRGGGELVRCHNAPPPPHPARSSKFALREKVLQNRFALQQSHVYFPTERFHKHVQVQHIKCTQDNEDRPPAPDSTRSSVPRIQLRLSIDLPQICRKFRVIQTIKMAKVLAALPEFLTCVGELRSTRNCNSSERFLGANQKNKRKTERHWNNYLLSTVYLQDNTKSHVGGLRLEWFTPN